MQRAHDNERTILRRGMTLIELLIVIAILVAIGGLLVVNIMPQREKAMIDLQRADFQRIDSAMKLFQINMNRYPTEEEGLLALTRKDALEDEEEATNWNGPYLEASALKDKWDNDIVYRNPSEELGEGSYDLVSFGPDGEEDTDDDITNHDSLRDESGEISEDDIALPPEE